MRHLRAFAALIASILGAENLKCLANSSLGRCPKFWWILFRAA